MSRDGQGSYSLPPGNPVVTETVISSTTHNTTLADVAQALTQSVSKDGQTTYTGNQSMGGNKHTQVANATARDQYATMAQVQDGNPTLIGSVSGTNTITGSLSPAITSYANGVYLTLIPTGANTTAVTLALNGLLARPVVKFNNVPLVAGDLIAGIPATLVYNGTNFYLENPQVVASDVARLGQSNNFTANNTFSVLGSATAPTVRLASGLPLLELNNTLAPVDNRSWLNYVTTGGNWVLASDNDAHTVATNLIVASKSTLALTATNITVNGVNVSDYARLSQSPTFIGVVTAGSGASDGKVSLTPGGATFPGYIAFYSPNGTRRGYIGFGDGSSNLFIASENGWNYRFTQAPNINGTLITDASVLTTGSLVNARVAQSNVTQHQAALSLGASQVLASIQSIISSVAVSSSHAGGVHIVENASTITLTVGVNALGNNGASALYVRRGAGAVNFLASGVTIRSPGGGLGVAIQNGKAGLIQVQATEYELCGNVA